jgi:pimeloyl-ACP methyl ester carboxylesterase
MREVLVLPLLLLLLTGDPPTLHRIPVAPAETLAVTMAGKGPPVVLLPGLFGSAYGYRAITRSLAEDGYRAIVIEPLGIGQSSRPFRSDYSLTAQSIRVAAVIDSLHVAPVIIVAHSVAGSIAFRLAVECPELVDGIVSLEGGPTEILGSRSFRRAMRWAPWLRLFGGRHIVRGKIHDMLVKSSGDTSWVTDTVIDGYTAGLQQDFGDVIGAYFRMAESREPWEIRPRLAELRCPVWLLLGAAPHEGSPTPEELRLMAEAIPALTIDSLPGAGHYLFEEQSGAVADAIMAAVRASRAARASRHVT